MKKIIIVSDMGKFDRQVERNVEKGIPTKGIVMTPDTFAKVFTPERIRLLQKLNENKASNIYKLAKQMEKPYEVVFRNIKYLAGFGLVKIEVKAKKSIPRLAHKIRIEMFSQRAEA